MCTSLGPVTFKFSFIGDAADESKTYFPECEAWHDVCAKLLYLKHAGEAEAD